MADVGQSYLINQALWMDFNKLMTHTHTLALFIVYAGEASVKSALDDCDDVDLFLAAVCVSESDRCESRP